MFSITQDYEFIKRNNVGQHLYHSSYITFAICRRRRAAYYKQILVYSSVNTETLIVLCKMGVLR